MLFAAVEALHHLFCCLVGHDLGLKGTSQKGGEGLNMDGKGPGVLCWCLSVCVGSLRVEGREGDGMGPRVGQWRREVPAVLCSGAGGTHRPVRVPLDLSPEDLACFSSVHELLATEDVEHLLRLGLEARLSCAFRSHGDRWNLVLQEGVGQEHEGQRWKARVVGGVVGASWCLNQVPHGLKLLLPLAPGVRRIPVCKTGEGGGGMSTFERREAESGRA